MILEKSSYHRNGIMGSGFTVGIVKDESTNERHLVIQFNDDTLHTAILDLKEIKEEKIDRMFRCEYFCDDFEKLIQKEES